MAWHLAEASRRIYAHDRALSRTAAEDAVRHGDLSQASVFRVSRSWILGVSGTDGCAQPGKRAQLRQRILRGDFAVRIGIEDGSDPAHLPALSAGSPIVEVPLVDEAPGAFAGVGEGRA